MFSMEGKIKCLVKNIGRLQPKWMFVPDVMKFPEGISEISCLRNGTDGQPKNQSCYRCGGIKMQTEISNLKKKKHLAANKEGSHAFTMKSCEVHSETDVGLICTVSLQNTVS